MAIGAQVSIVRAASVNTAICKYWDLFIKKNLKIRWASDRQIPGAGGNCGS
jgi:hypothetical protein